MLHDPHQFAVTAEFAMQTLHSFKFKLVPASAARSLTHESSLCCHGSADVRGGDSLRGRGRVGSTRPLAAGAPSSTGAVGLQSCRRSPPRRARGVCAECRRRLPRKPLQRARVGVGSLYPTTALSARSSVRRGAEGAAGTAAAAGCPRSDSDGESDTEDDKRVFA